MPTPVFVHRASAEAGDEFFAERAPDQRVIADPDGELFRGFGLERGSFLQLLGPRVWWRGLVALFKGNFVGLPTGNETQMPGAFVVRGQQIVWAHRARHAGDHPDFDAMRRALDPDAEPAAETAAKTAPKAAGNTARKIRSLAATHRKILAEAQQMQRNGDLRTFAQLTAEADEVAKELDRLEQGQT